jgi:hypothetical protein
VPFPINCSCPVSALTNAIRFLRRPTVQSHRRVPGSITSEQSGRRNVFLLREPWPFSLCISSPLLRTHSFVYEYHPPTLLCPSTTGLAYKRHIKLEWFKYLLAAWSVLLVVTIYYTSIYIYIYIYIYIHAVCLKSSLNGTRKQTKQKIQTN